MFAWENTKELVKALCCGNIHVMIWVYYNFDKKQAKCKVTLGLEELF